MNRHSVYTGDVTHSFMHAKRNKRKGKPYLKVHMGLLMFWGLFSSLKHSCVHHVLSMCQEMCICYLEWSLKAQRSHWCRDPHHCGLSLDVPVISGSISFLTLIYFHKNLMSSNWFLYCKFIMEHVIKKQKKKSYRYQRFRFAHKQTAHSVQHSGATLHFFMFRVQEARISGYF